MEHSAHSELTWSGTDPDHDRRLSHLGAQIARVAHELNTPVSLIAGSLGNLDQHVSALLHYASVSRAYTAAHPELAQAYDEARIDYVLAHTNNLLAICDEGVQRLNYIVGQLRGYGRRGDAATVAGTDVGELVQRAERMARSAHPGAPAVEWDLAVEARVAADGDTVLPALVNIIANAFDAVGGRPQPRVRIAIHVNADHEVEVRISDNGPGVPEAMRRSVFEPFFTTKRPGAGVGLGLAIAKDAIEEAGGTIDIGDTRGGAEFVVRLVAVRG
jgi:two-component system sensor histidine kinase HupT/HoxJ